MNPPVPPPIPLVRAAVLRPVVRLLARRGGRVERLLDAANVPVTVLDAPDSLVPTHQACGFIEAAAREIGADDIGLLAGGEGPFELLGTLGCAIRGARTLDEAIQTAMRLFPAFSSGGRCDLADEGDRVRLSHDLGDGRESRAAHAGQLGLMLSFGLARLATDPRRRRSDGGPSVRGATSVLPGIRLHTERTTTVVSFPRSLLGRPLSQSNPARRIPDAEVAAWMASGPAGDFPGSLLQVVTTLSSPTYPRIARAARSIGMSVRALQRRLATTGMSYGHLLDRARFITAVDLLERTDAPVLAVALDLGYSDHAHFTRAFRRWTGLAPRVFRRTSRRAGDQLAPMGSPPDPGVHRPSKVGPSPCPPRQARSAIAR